MDKNEIIKPDLWGSIGAIQELTKIFDRVFEEERKQLFYNFNLTVNFDAGTVGMHTDNMSKYIKDKDHLTYLLLELIKNYDTNKRVV